MKINRIVRRTNSSYSTKSNKIRIIRTPGNKLNSLKITKKSLLDFVQLINVKLKVLPFLGLGDFLNLLEKKKVFQGFTEVVFQFMLLKKI